MSIQTALRLEPGVWRVERSRSEIRFRVRHFGVATVRGHFDSFAGRIDVDDEGLRAEGLVDTASVDTGNGIRDARLRSEFFDADLHPAIAFQAVGRLGGTRLRGQLTIRGTTRPVELALTVQPLEDDAVHMRAETRIRRSDFGLEWEALRDAGRVLVADEVQLVADVVVTHEPLTARA